MRSELKKMMDYCTYCPKMCTFSCPISETTRDTSLTPWAKMQAARWLTERAVPLSPELVATSYQCLQCNHCMEYCEHHNDVSSALRETRKLAVENYAAPPEVYDLERRFSLYNNPYGKDLNASLQELHASQFDQKSEKIFFPTCHTLALFPDRMRTYLDLFRKLGIGKLRICHQEIQCCGEPLHSLGFESEYREIVELQYYALKSGKLIVTEGAECAYHFKHVYSEQDLSLAPRIVHLFEWIEPYFRHANLNIPAKSKTRLAYLDPVFLSRFLKIREIPRRILSQVTGFAPLELSQSAQDAFEVGTEGSYDCVHSEVSDQIARRILDELEGRGIGLLITADAKAEAKLRGLSKQIEIRDFFEFLNEHIKKG